MSTLKKILYGKYFNFDSYIKALLNVYLLFRGGRCPTLRNRGLHDVGHVGAATGRGAKPRQASWGEPVSTLRAAEH